MKKLNRLIALATALMMFGSASQGFAQTQYQEYAGGAGYLESRDSPSLAPAIALGAIALIAIIAVAVQNSNTSHSH